MIIKQSRQKKETFSALTNSMTCIILNLPRNIEEALNEDEITKIIIFISKYNLINKI